MATSVLLGLPQGSLFAYVAGILLSPPPNSRTLTPQSWAIFVSMWQVIFSTPTKIFSVAGSNVKIVLFFCTFSLVVPVQFSRLVKYTCPCNILLPRCANRIFEKLGLHYIGALVAGQARHWQRGGHPPTVWSISFFKPFKTTTNSGIVRPPSRDC